MYSSEPLFVGLLQQAERRERLPLGDQDARTALARQGEPGEKNVPVSDCRAVNKLSESVICFN